MIKIAIESYVNKKYPYNNLIKKTIIEKIKKDNYDLNKLLKDNYFNRLELLYDQNVRNGVLIEDIINIDDNTQEVYFSFRGLDILIFNIKTKELKFIKEDFSMCIFLEKDYQVMSLFLNNVFLYKNDLGVELESYEVN